MRKYCEELQQNMSYEPEWLKLSIDKCEVPHGEKNILISHKMMSSELSITIQKRDLKIIINSSMELSFQYSVAI